VKYSLLTEDTISLSQSKPPFVSTHHPLIHHTPLCLIIHSSTTHLSFAPPPSLSSLEQEHQTCPPCPAAVTTTTTNIHQNSSRCLAQIYTLRLPGRLCNLCAGIPGYLRDVRNAGWAGQVFESYEQLAEWLRQQQHDEGFPGSYVETENGSDDDAENAPGNNNPGNGNGNGGRSSQLPSPSSSSSDDPRPNSTILGPHHIPARLPQKMRHRLYGRSRDMQAMRDRLSRPPGSWKRRH
jgi:hypothetical protein